MNDIERAELAEAIAKHLPGLPDGAVEWGQSGALVRVNGRPMTFETALTWDGVVTWRSPTLPGRGTRLYPTADSALTAVRAHFVTALATARADAAAYERALGEDGSDTKRGRFVLQPAGVTDRHREVGARLSCAWPSLTDCQLVAIGRVLDRVERGRQ